LASFSEGLCDFGVKAAVAKRQALIEREPHVGHGFSVKRGVAQLAIAGLAFAGVVGDFEVTGCVLSFRSVWPNPLAR